MKRSLLLIFLLVHCSLAEAQQDPQFTQTSSLGFAFNPALAGSGEKLCGTLANRQQWTGFTNHPVTSVLSVHAPVYDWNSGVGLNVFVDKLGQESTFNIQGAYAYRMRLHNGIFSGGVSIGYVQKSLGADYTLPPELKQIDFLIPETGVADGALDVGAGLYFANPTYFVGLSVTKAHEPVLRLESGNKSVDFNLARHFYGMAGYRFAFRSWALIPTMWYRSDAVEPQLETTVKAEILEGAVRLGASYRHKDAISPIVDFYFPMGFRSIHLGYSYDITLSTIRVSSFGTHEILLGVCQPLFKKIKKWKNPRNLGPYNYF